MTRRLSCVPLGLLMPVPVKGGMMLSLSRQAW